MSAAETGDTSSDFRADRDKQVTQTAGVNPDPPAAQSASVPADAPPMVADCIIGPYSGYDLY